MAEKSGIEWTDATWNPITGCDHVSAGCDFCYAEKLAQRLRVMGSPRYADGFAVRTHEAVLSLPLRWRGPRKVFVNSMSDCWHHKVPSEFLDRMFAVMALTPQHTYQILTKRPQRAANYLNADMLRVTAIFAAMQEITGKPRVELTWPLPNVWIGTSVEDCRVAHRIDALRRCPAAVRFLSCEPLLGPLRDLNLDGIGWVIAGGESAGPEERRLVTHYGDRAAAHQYVPTRDGLLWVRDLRDQCVAAGVPFLFKQWGGPKPKSGGRTLDGRTWDEYPTRAGEAVAS